MAFQLHPHFPSETPQGQLPEDQLSASWTGSKEWTKESQGLAAGLAASAANAFHEEIAVKAFISVVSKAPGKALPRAGTLTCRIRFKLPNWQQEPVVQRAEDDTYLQLYRQMARKEQDNLTKMRKYPASARLQARKSALDSTLSRFLRVQMYIRHRLLLAKTWLEDIASGRTLNCKDIS